MKRISIIRVLRNTVALSALGCIAFAGVWLEDIGAFAISPESIKPITDFRAYENSIIYDRDGHKIGELFSRYQVFVPYEELPGNLITSVVAIEDRKFFEHYGIDPIAIIRAAWSFVTHGKITQGASTITQQVVRNFLLTGERSLERKVKEMILAVYLETHVSKKRIFEIYTNALFLGNGSYGVGAAAYRYFGKNLGELQNHEFALLAGLFQSPSRYNPHLHPKKAKRRQYQVVRALWRNRFITLSEAQNLINQPLDYKPYRPINPVAAPYFVDYVASLVEKHLDMGAKNRGLRIHTTLDHKLQQQAKQSVQNYRSMLRGVSEREGNIPLEAAVLVTDPHTGHILAMEGGLDYRKSQFNRTVRALRSPGSAFKPIIYSLALAHGRKWSDLIYVGPVTIDNYRPKNFSQSFLSETTMLRAFYKSINTPSIEIGKKLGLLPIIQHANQLGVSQSLKKEFGTLLGSSEVTMLDLARVYGSFATLGNRVEPIAITKILNRSGQVLYQAQDIPERTERVLPEKTAGLMTQGLRSVFAHGTAAKYPQFYPFAAGKTGTSNQSKDNWFCGFTNDFVTIVWVGPDQQKPLSAAVTGSSVALPLWGQFMETVYADREKTPLPIPKGISRKKVHPRFGHLSSQGIPMYFLDGTAPDRNFSDLETLSRVQNFRGIFDGR